MRGSNCVGCGEEDCSRQGTPKQRMTGDQILFLYNTEIQTGGFPLVNCWIILSRIDCSNLWLHALLYSMLQDKKSVTALSEIACWLECRTRDRKVASSNPRRISTRIFFSRVNFVCWLLFGARSTPVLPQWHIKDPGHSAKSAGVRLHLNTHTPLTQRSWSGLTMSLPRHSVGTLSGNEYTRNLSGNTRSQLSQLTEPLWTNPDEKSGIHVRKLISI